MNSKHFISRKHIYNLINKKYYKNLILLRNSVVLSCDNFFQKYNAPRVDLYMISKNSSSPMGKGSDSKPISFILGNQHLCLVDSAQFGMEPLVQKAFEMVYCYLPSFRGEKADDRHLNQFYHCEAELRGNLNYSMDIAESLIKHIIRDIYLGYKKTSFRFTYSNFGMLKKAIEKRFDRISFDEAHSLLKNRGFSNMVKQYNYGRVISNEGEIKITELVNGGMNPIWLTHYDRNVVPFYQKPDKNDSSKTLNADLIFPSIRGSIGGEIVGLGQRQDNMEEMIQSMKRQGIERQNTYKWYLNMRKRKNYSVTSGFGVGIERLIAWSLGLKSIVDTAIYPVIKNEKIYY